MHSLFCTMLLVIVGFSVNAHASDLDATSLQESLQTVVKGFDGRIGVCTQTNKRRVAIGADDRFSMQSVVKLIVGVAVLDVVDKSR